MPPDSDTDHQPVKIFKLNDYEWYVAVSLEEAKAARKDTLTALLTLSSYFFSATH